jgi:hypothetical protein
MLTERCKKTTRFDTPQGGLTGLLPNFLGRSKTSSTTRFGGKMAQKNDEETERHPCRCADLLAVSC